MNDSEQLLFTAWLEAAGVGIADSDYMFQERREFLRALREVKASAWDEGYLDGCWDGQNDTPYETENPYEEGGQ